VTAPRMSIRLLGVIIALVAVECAAFQPSLSGDSYGGFWVNAIALPMTSFLILAFYRQRCLRRRGEQSPGLTGFQVAGWLAVAAALALFLNCPNAYLKLVVLFDPVHRAWIESQAFRSVSLTSPTAVRMMWCAEISMALALSTVVTAALLSVAFCGGWLGAHLHR
jgi:hypothetical protein